jgi:acetyltransferase
MHMQTRPEKSGGDSDGAERSREALRAALAESVQQGFSGEITWLDGKTTGRLGDLANSRADLALIALPHDEVASALEIVGRVRCRAATTWASRCCVTRCRRCGAAGSAARPMR